MAGRKKGTAKTGGREKGTLNTNTKQVKDVLANVFSELQDDKTCNLLAWGKENPTEFYKLAAKLIPTQMQHSGEMNMVWQELKNYDSNKEADKST